MAVETGQAIITAIHTRVTGDSSLQTTLGGTFNVYRWPNLPNDPDLPYFSQRLSFRNGLFYGEHDYYLDLFYYGDDSAVVDEAIDRVKILLHEWTYTTASDEVSGFIEWFSGGYVPTGDPLVWHFATQWTVEIGAARDTTNIVG